MRNHLRRWRFRSICFKLLVLVQSDRMARHALARRLREQLVAAWLSSPEEKRHFPYGTPMTIRWPGARQLSLPAWNSLLQDISCAPTDLCQKLRGRLSPAGAAKPKVKRPLAALDSTRRKSPPIGDQPSLGAGARPSQAPSHARGSGTFCACVGPSGWHP